MSDLAHAITQQVIIGGRTIGSDNYVSVAQALILGAYMMRTNQSFTIASENFEELIRYDGAGNLVGVEPYLAELKASYGTVKQIVDSTYQAGFNASAGAVEPRS